MGCLGDGETEGHEKKTLEQYLTSIHERQITLMVVD
jgi:hypothetical protein